jgi:flagellar basal-body rod protein FlgG
LDQFLPSTRPTQTGRVDDLVARAMAAPTMEERTAAVLGVADSSTGQLSALLRGLEGAEEIVLDNVRNADTTGYKAVRVQNAGVEPVTSLDMSQGRMMATGNSLDVGIQGEGFFAVAMPEAADGVAYTRNGNFFVNEKSELVLGIGEGYRLTPAITLPANVTDIVISQGGMVSARNSRTGEVVRCGEIELVRFANPAGLKAGHGLLMETAASGRPMVVEAGKGTAGSLMQNFLEGSNVDLSGENVRLRFLQSWRSYVLHAIDERADESNATLAHFREQ